MHIRGNQSPRLHEMKLKKLKEQLTVTDEDILLP